MAAKRPFQTAIMLILAMVIANACTSDRQAPGDSLSAPERTKKTGIVQLKAITMGSEPASGMDRFYEQLDALTIKDLGMTVRFDFIPWGDEKTQISRAITAKEYDFYVGGYWSDFAVFATKNAFANLSPLLDQVPALVEHYRGSLDHVKIKGHVYGIPQLITPGGGGEGMLYREDLRQAWGLPEITDLKTAEQYLYRAASAYPGVPMINDKRFADNIWTLIAGSKYLNIDNGFAVAEIDAPYQAISKYATPEYKQVAEIAKRWYEDGIVAHDILAAPDNATSETLELMKLDKKPLEFNNHFGAVSGSYIDALKEIYPKYVYGWFDYGLYNVPMYLPSISPDRVTTISIGAHSKHVALALKFLEKVHTDQTYYNLVQYGVNGENVNIDGEYLNYDGIPPENKKPGWTGLSDGYMNLKTRYPGEWQTIFDDLQEKALGLMDRAQAYPLDGFAFDTTGVADELANMEKARNQYLLPLSVGISDSIDQDLNAAAQQLQNAGIDKYMEALQQQLDAFARSASK